jgi:hypothetical protein
MTHRRREVFTERLLETLRSNRVTVAGKAIWRKRTPSWNTKRMASGQQAGCATIMGVHPLADRRKFLNEMPAPARLLNRLAWEPRYRMRTLWQV